MRADEQQGLGMRENRVLLLGEVNPYGPSPEFALYCDPPGCSGHRLRLILGLPEDTYLGLHRKNLKAAQKRAFELLSPQAPWQVIVLLGRKVTRAFEKLALSDETLNAFSTRDCCPGMTLVSLPHPSGQNAGLWPPSARDRARQILRELVPEVPWGSTDAKEAVA